MTPSATRLSSAVVRSAIFIDAVSVGIVLPVLPDLLVELTGAGIGDTALMAGLLATCYAVMLFLFGPLMGALPDRFGRRAQGSLPGAPFAAAGLMTIALFITLRPIPRYR
jgi:DHA1 family tetracycline resistance protein-like MFS transporter